MTGQGTLFAPGSANREEAVPVQAKLLARKTDPLTSKRTALKTFRSGRPKTSLVVFLRLLWDYGPLTAKQASVFLDRPDFWQVEFCKRTEGWRVAGHIRVAQNAAGLERMVDGSRVWEAVA